MKDNQSLKKSFNKIILKLWNTVTWKQKYVQLFFVLYNLLFRGGWFEFFKNTIQIKIVLIYSNNQIK